MCARAQEIRGLLEGGGVQPRFFLLLSDFAVCTQLLFFSIIWSQWLPQTFSQAQLHTGTCWWRRSIATCTPSRNTCVENGLKKTTFSLFLERRAEPEQNLWRHYDLLRRCHRLPCNLNVLLWAFKDKLNVMREETSLVVLTKWMS